MPPEFRRRTILAVLWIRKDLLRVQILPSQCCALLWILIFPHPDPGFWISDPGSNNNKKGGEKICFHTFFVAVKFTKFKIILFLNRYRIFFFTNWQRIKIFLLQYFTKLSDIWVWDPGSGKKLIRIQESTKHRIPDPHYWCCGYGSGRIWHFLAFMDPDSE